TTVDAASSSAQAMAAEPCSAAAATAADSAIPAAAADVALSLSTQLHAWRQHVSELDAFAARLSARRAWAMQRVRLLQQRAVRLSAGSRGAVEPGLFGGGHAQADAGAEEEGEGEGESERKHDWELMEVMRCASASADALMQPVAPPAGPAASAAAAEGSR